MCFILLTDLLYCVDFAAEFDIFILEGDLADSDLILYNRRRQAADIVYSSG